MQVLNIQIGTSNHDKMYTVCVIKDNFKFRGTLLTIT